MVELTKERLEERQLEKLEPWLLNIETNKKGLTEEQLCTLEWAKEFMDAYEKRNKHTLRKQKAK